jgi:hypothetical protein
MLSKTKSIGNNSVNACLDLLKIELKDDLFIFILNLLSLSFHGIFRNQAYCFYLNFKLAYLGEGYSVSFLYYS